MNNERPGFDYAFNMHTFENTISSDRLDIKHLRRRVEIPFHALYTVYSDDRRGVANLEGVLMSSTLAARAFAPVVR